MIKTFDINTHTWLLLESEPLFAEISRRVTKISTKNVPTAGISFDNNQLQFVMYYNPDFMGSQKKEHIKGILKHEFYHIILDHVTQRKPQDKKEYKLWNIACDLSINCHIQDELPENCCIPGKNQFDMLPPFKNAEWYFHELKKLQKEGKLPPDDLLSTFDIHDWENLTEEEKEIIKEKARQIIKEAVDDIQEKNWGNVSSEMKKYILEKINPIVDWKKVLRYFIKATLKSTSRFSIKHLNRRMPYVYRGKSYNKQAKIAVYCDQSGSVDDKLFATFLSEIQSLSNLVSIDYFPFDTKVEETQKQIIKKNTKIKRERVLSGGTNFDAPTAHANENNYDGIIILTDMQAPKPISCKCQRLWLTNEQGYNQPYFQTNERMVWVK
jgi:predicted metal-dependent peptidase